MEPKPGSMGRPGPQYRIDLVDADGKPVADGEEGEIVIHIDGERPLGLFREYLHDPELTAEASQADLLGWWPYRRCDKVIGLPHRPV